MGHEAYGELYERDEELEELDWFCVLSAEAGPVLAELWDNEKDAAYGSL